MTQEHDDKREPLKISVVLDYTKDDMIRAIIALDSLMGALRERNGKEKAIRAMEFVLAKHRDED